MKVMFFLIEVVVTVTTDNLIKPENGNNENLIKPNNENMTKHNI